MCSFLKCCSRQTKLLFKTATLLNIETESSGSRIIPIDVVKEQESVYVVDEDAKSGRRKELPRKKEAKVIVNS